MSNEIRTNRITKRAWIAVCFLGLAVSLTLYGSFIPNFLYAGIGVVFMIGALLFLRRTMNEGATLSSKEKWK